MKIDESKQQGVFDEPDEIAEEGDDENGLYFA
jgi:hypothetical protein